jgi:D-psicose/D-tagatose/L-ribulose 3-epimerase
VQFGINLLLWTDTPYSPEFLPLYARLKEMGFDGVELPMFSGNPEDYRKLGERLHDLGLERTATVIRNEPDDPISSDAAVRGVALESMKHAIDCAEAASAKLIGGPFYAAIGKFSGSPPTAQEWQYSVDYMRQAADYAQRAGIELSLEFLNRFEIYLLNCTADTKRFVQEVDRPNVGVHYDTFHANLEEKNVDAAIRDAAETITHVHISENDRGTPGQGQVRWEETFKALSAIGYDGWMTIEAFGQALPGLAAATKIWRPLFESEEQLAADGLAFMREHAG